MGGSLSKEEIPQAFGLWTEIAGKKGETSLTTEMLQAYFPKGTPEGIFKLVRKCKGNKKHPYITQFGYQEWLRGGILYSWAQFNPSDETHEIEYGDMEEGLRRLRKGSNEEIAEITQIICSRMDKAGKKKVTLRDFIEYAMDCITQEKDPWAFIDDDEFLKVARAEEEASGGGKKKKKAAKKKGEKGDAASKN